jgi:cell division protein FtsB
MAVITVVLAVLVVSYASSMKAYLQQRGQINTLNSAIARSQQDIASLEREKKRWNDPAYVKDQATRRFGWVLPGEVAYQVIDRNGKPMGTTNQLSDPNRVVHVTPTAWWAKQASSLARADHPPKVQPPPASKITPKNE